MFSVYVKLISCTFLSSVRKLANTYNSDFTIQMLAWLTFIFQLSTYNGSTQHYCTNCRWWCQLTHICFPPQCQSILHWQAVRMMSVPANLTSFLIIFSYSCNTNPYFVTIYYSCLLPWQCIKQWLQQQKVNVIRLVCCIFTQIYITRKQKFCVSSSLALFNL